MIIDLHTRSWANLDQLGPEAAEMLRAQTATRWHHLDASPPAHEQATACVDGSLIIGYRADRLGAHVPNEYIAQIVTAAPNRRLGVGGVDPMGPEPLEQVDGAVNLGLVGVAVSPPSQGFHPTHSSAMQVYERCRDAGLPVFVTSQPTTANTILDFAHPALWDEVARSFPDLPIVISHLGHPWIDQTLVLIGKHSNVFADISGVVSRPWQLYNALLSAASFGVMDKLLFGSGFPFDLPAKAIESVYSVNSYGHGTQLPTIPRASIRAIVERDSLSCLGIVGEIQPRHEPGELGLDSGLPARPDRATADGMIGEDADEESEV